MYDVEIMWLLSDLSHFDFKRQSVMALNVKEDRYFGS